jgi:hypothetical protein
MMPKGFITSKTPYNREPKIHFLFKASVQDDIPHCKASVWAQDQVKFWEKVINPYLMSKDINKVTCKNCLVSKLGFKNYKVVMFKESELELRKSFWDRFRK